MLSTIPEKDEPRTGGLNLFWKKNKLKTYKKRIAAGCDDTFPRIPNNTKAGRTKNRRVKFVLEKK